jgi:hypothetical protein
MLITTFSFEQPLYYRLLIIRHEHFCTCTIFSASVLRSASHVHDDTERQHILSCSQNTLSLPTFSHTYFFLFSRRHRTTLERSGQELSLELNGYLHRVFFQTTGVGWCAGWPRPIPVVNIHIPLSYGCPSACVSEEPPKLDSWILTPLLL